MKQLSESEVTIKTLVECFTSAFLKVADEESDSFWVPGESLKTKVTIDEKRKYLRFSIVYQLSDKTTSSVAITQCNKVNEEYIVIRFSALEIQGTQCVACNYYMTYEEGLIAFQLIKMVKKFEQFTVEALREHFNDYL